MPCIDVPVYKTCRKYPRLPVYETESVQPQTIYKDVPILVVTEDELDLILVLDYSDVIRKHKTEPLLIFTDKTRVLAVAPQGYDFAKNVCVIDEETAQNVLNMEGMQIERSSDH